MTNIPLKKNPTSPGIQEMQIKIIKDYLKDILTKTNVIDQASGFSHQFIENTRGRGTLE
jgi:hypothetical protein